MSNLGQYQWVTTAAKKVGGPGVLLSLFAGGGILIGAVGSKIGSGIKNRYNRKKEEKQKIENKNLAIIYNIKKDGKDEQNIQFKKGDKFKVLAKIDDGLLIEIIGDDNNPYVVSLDFIINISDYSEK